MIRVYSITNILRQFNTNGSQPVLVMANNHQDYVCKYPRSAANFSKPLVNEYLGSCFLKQWNINTPDIAVVQVKPEHINEEIFNLQPAWFKRPCFGSQYNRYFQEFDKFVGSSSQNKGIKANNNFLRTALFDIWVGNDDRNIGNFNLMIDTTNFNNLVSIDHGDIFNTSSIYGGRELYLLSYEDSILSSPLLTKIYTKKTFYSKVFRTNLEKEYYLCIDRCERNFAEIIKDLPSEWCDDKPNLSSIVSANLFNDEWKKNCWKLFLEFIHTNLKTT